MEHFGSVRLQKQTATFLTEAGSRTWVVSFTWLPGQRAEHKRIPCYDIRSVIPPSKQFHNTGQKELPVPLYRPLVNI